MPLERGAALQLGVLLLAVPAQYLVSQYMSTTPAQRTFAVNSMLNSARKLTHTYLSWDAWQNWCQELLNNLHGASLMDDRGESPAIEVLQYEDPNGYFAGSPEPRTPRGEEVTLRVGQVVRHKVWGYRALVVGWDHSAKAPERWLSQMHPPDKPHWRKQPNYSLLVDTRDRLHAQVTYVPQENLQVITDTKIFHPDLDTYFEGFDGAQYLPRPFLRALYPHD